MLTRSRGAVVTALLLTGTASLLAQRVPTVPLDAYVTKALADWQAPGLALAVVRNDSVILAKGYGVRELGKPDPVTAHTLFAVGSTSKAFTVAALGMLVDEGKLTWDDPVTQHLTTFQLYDPYVTRELTVRDLLTHRSGLARGDRVWAASGLSRAEVLRRVRFLKPSWSFRSTYGYQNIMYLAAGSVVEATSGLTWDEFVRRRIFGPLGMSRSVTSVVPLAGMTDVATPHEKIDGKPTPVAWLNIDNIGPAGSINSSATEMAQWVRLQLGKGTYAGTKLLEPATVREMHQAQMHQARSEEDEKLYPESSLLSYGLGWSLRDYRGMKLVAHGGAIRGMRAQVSLLPERNLGVVVLANVSESNLATAMAMKLLDLHTAGPPKDWSAVLLASTQAAQERAAEERRKVVAARVQGTAPSLALDRYAGVYADSLYGEIRIEKQGSGLVATFGAFYTGDLAHWHFDTFEVAWRDPVLGRATVTFALDARGDVRSLEYSNLGTFGRTAALPGAARAGAP
jgi:CubicO group peptidase (beta-lactamase class C family)